MKIEAVDTAGNKFIKTVVITESAYDGRKVISFGWPMEYYFDDLIKHYPYEKDFCIDMMGCNHKGSQVTISRQNMNKLIEMLKE